MTGDIAEGKGTRKGHGVIVRGKFIVHSVRQDLEQYGFAESFCCITAHGTAAFELLKKSRKSVKSAHFHEKPVVPQFVVGLQMDTVTEHGTQHQTDVFVGE